MNKRGALTIDVVIALLTLVIGGVIGSFATFFTRNEATELRESIKEIKSDVKEILKEMRHG